MEGLITKLNQLGITAVTVVILQAVLIVILLVFLVVLLVRQHRINVRLNYYLSGKSGRSLEKTIRELHERVEQYEENYLKISDKYDDFRLGIKSSYKKIGIVKYDAFKGMNGKLSFVLCLLDDFNSGFIMNNMKTVDGNFTYLKEIIHGNCSTPLSGEEEQALAEAKECEKFE